MEIVTRSALPEGICHPCFLLPNTTILGERRQPDDREHARAEQTARTARAGSGELRSRQTRGNNRRIL